MNTLVSAKDLATLQSVAIKGCSRIGADGQFNGSQVIHTCSPSGLRRMTPLEVKRNLLMSNCNYCEVCVIVLDDREVMQSAEEERQRL